jgi:two-component system sensor histidine kinase HydH
VRLVLFWGIGGEIAEQVVAMAEHGAEANQERALRLALLGEIAGEAAHELRNALAVITASAELLRGADEARAESHLLKIQRNARLAQDLVDSLMALARGEHIHAEPVLLGDVLVDARRDVLGAASYEDDFDPQTTLLGSQVLLSRAFRILYENATQAAAPRAPTITTRARLDDDILSIDVADDGPGVPETIRETLFEPLVTQKPGGTGLGLALARRAVRAHDGELELVASERGACFRLRLPTRPGRSLSAG